jgi:hypothetical protein
VRDAGLAAGREPVDRSAAEQHALGAERHRLRDVGTAPHPAVHEQRHPAADCAGDVG